MLKRMNFMMGLMVGLVGLIMFSQSALALGQVEKVTIDLEQSYNKASVDTVLNQKMSNSGDILLAQNCSEVCGPSPTKECGRWGKNRCCECCEPLPPHCEKLKKWKERQEKRKEAREERRKERKDRWSRNNDTSNSIIVDNNTSCNKKNSSNNVINNTSTTKCVKEITKK